MFETGERVSQEEELMMGAAPTRATCPPALLGAFWLDAPPTKLFHTHFPADRTGGGERARSPHSLWIALRRFLEVRNIMRLAIKGYYFQYYLHY